MSEEGAGPSQVASPPEEGRREIAPELRDYIGRGWRLIPMIMAEKKPTVRWRRYQKTAPSRNTITRWIAEQQNGAAVIFGEPSGGLVSRDFDTMESYNNWAATYPELAATLPTVSTRRGRHVYARATAEDVIEVRRKLGRPETATGAIRVEDGELRAGSGCYSVVPPSIHPSGHHYAWAVPLPDGPIPLVDLLQCGFVDFGHCDREHRDNGGVLRVTEAMNDAGVVEPGTLHDHSSSGLILDWDATVELAILSALPTAPGHRHEQVFQLARGLKAVPSIADANPRDLEMIVRRFHRLALPCIRTKPFEETWIDFLRAWKNVKFPLGQEPMAEIMRAVENSPAPLVAEKYEQAALRKLVSICRELQRAAGNDPFYLACRTAGRLLGVDHSTANRWLFLLTSDQVLREVQHGSRATKRASRYRYLHQL